MSRRQPIATLPYVPGSATSQMAAAGAVTRAPTQRERIRQYIAQASQRGATIDEIESTLGVAHQSISPRMRELYADGRIAKLVDTRVTRRGSAASVFVTPEFVSGRETIAYVKYMLVGVSEETFNEVFADYDDEWRTQRWTALKARKSK